MPRDLIAAARQSLKFRRWKPQPSKIKLGPLALTPSPADAVIEEKHYSPTELAKAWGLSPEMIRQLFVNEPGVLVIRRHGTRFKRVYKTIRIPQSVAQRLHNRLSGAA
jgi:hypothetical protein